MPVPTIYVYFIAIDIPYKLGEIRVIRQDHSSSFKYDLRCVVSPGEVKDPRPNTKLLLSVSIKA